MQSDPLVYQSDSTSGRLRKLAQASSIITSTRPLDILPKVIAEQARTVISAHLCVVQINLDQATSYVAVACSEEYAPWQEHTDLLGALGASVNRPTRLTQAELESQPAWHSLMDRIRSWRPVCGWLAAPITGADNYSLGLIQLLDTSIGEFSEDDEVFLTQLGQVIALAIENVRLHGQAQHTTQIRDELLSLISHELKNPITSLRGFAQLLLRQLDKNEPLEPDRLRRTLQSIEQISERMTRLINDVREVARLDSGRLTLELKPVDMATLAESVAAGLQTGVSRRPITVSGTQPVIAVVDPLRWRQLLMYLIENVSASSTGRGPIEIEALNQDGTGPQLAVIDRESSSSTKDWQQLVERVRQARSPASLGGAGLSLYIVYQMIRLHGGQLGVEELTNGGTRIVISLPAAPGDFGKGERE
jgi:signal transduction histidine kinase